jgi:DNA-binding transcriptional regulator YiaG
MRAMPNIAAVLKTEISRIARKEMRSEIQSLKQAVSSQRAQIATLKKRAETAERLLRQLSKGAARSAPAREAAGDDESAGGLRFSAKGLKSLRTKLALSANDMGLLLGATGQSVYNWESGKVRPHAKHLPAIAALRGMGKKEVAKRLEALQAQAA